MKKLLIGLLALGSISSFANNEFTPAEVEINGVIHYVVDENEDTDVSYDDSADGYCASIGMESAIKYGTGPLEVSPLVALDIEGNILEIFPNNDESNLMVIMDIVCI
jgi:hypothetical protein